DYPFPDRELLRSDFQRQPPLYPVGRVYQYSNIGLSLAGEAAVAVSGQNFAQLVKTGILAPLGLEDTRPFLPLDLLGSRLAVGWSPLDRSGQRSLLKPFDTRAIAPAAGFSSTAEDLVRFGLWQAKLLREEKASASTDVLRPSTLREMHRVQFTDPVRDGHWGLGFVVEQEGDKTYVGHDGSCPGYHTAMLLQPDTETVVAVMTTDNHEVWGDAMQAHKLLEARASHSFRGSPPVAVELEDYTGRYVNGTWENETIILPWNGGLVTLGLPDAKPAESLSILKPVARDRFRRMAKDGGEMHEVSFERDSAGRVVSIVEFFNRSMRVVP
ncbi:MAG: serine hydrolase domain-containing protein, partial [Gammaproteobacteria bacterium]